MANVQHVALTGADLHEAKGVAAATINDLLVADGAGSADWVNPTAVIEVSLDLGSTLTRSFVGATAFTDFILDYDSAHAQLFTYNDTTKEITYTGTRDIIIKYSMSLSIARTDTGGSPELSVAMFIDTGAGFGEITNSLVARTFPGNDVGVMAMMAIHTLQNGDKIKLQVKTDAGIDVALRNLNWSVHSIGLV